MLLESNDSDCQELVSTLMEKSPRLKEEATKPEVLRSLAAGMSRLPGLSLVGSADETLAQIGEEATKTASSAMEGRVTIDHFLSMHVKPINKLLENDAEIDDTLVDELLNTQGSGPVKLKEPSREAVFRESDMIPFDMGVAVEAMTSGPKSKEDSEKSKNKWCTFDLLLKNDRLNLTGLLNVLDGVVDTPGRMLIMTTNHPELLDPALIRPGRIDKKILLGFMSAEDVILMLEHYFQTELSLGQRLQVEELIHGNPETNRPQLNLTPAQVEQLAAEHDELDQMIRALEVKGRSRIVHDQTQNGGRTSSKIAFDI
jgi:hypothetical protein